MPLCVLQQLEQDVLDVFAYVAGLGQRGGVADGEGHVEHASQRAGHERLAGAGRPDEQGIALVDLDVVFVHLVRVDQPLVVVMHGNGHGAFGLVLSDDVLVQEFHDFARLGHVLEQRPRAAAAALFTDQIVALFDAR